MFLAILKTLKSHNFEEWMHYIGGMKIKPKSHYCEDRTVRICTMCGPLLIVPINAEIIS